MIKWVDPLCFHTHSASAYEPTHNVEAPVPYHWNVRLLCCRNLCKATRMTAPHCCSDTLWGNRSGIIVSHRFMCKPPPNGTVLPQVQCYIMMLIWYNGQELRLRHSHYFTQQPHQKVWMTQHWLKIETKMITAIQNAHGVTHRSPPALSLKPQTTFVTSTDDRVEVIPKDIDCSPNASMQ